MLTERANMPAADLTWHDARAYCAWLTEAWRKAGRITQEMVVRLPSEPEWERAARGDQKAASNAFVHPWVVLGTTIG
jgi:iron(II)-dependent oxidoreductase